MAEPTDIKDKSPNAELIKVLETILEEAKAGDCRSGFFVLGWDNDAVTHTWEMDPRTTPKRFFGGVGLAVTDLALNFLSRNEGSSFAKILENNRNTDL